jgi:hypothetical protein
MRLTTLIIPAGLSLFAISSVAQDMNGMQGDSMNDGMKAHKMTKKQKMAMMRKQQMMKKQEMMQHNM